MFFKLILCYGVCQLETTSAPGCFSVQAKKFWYKLLVEFYVGIFLKSTLDIQNGVEQCDCGRSCTLIPILSLQDNCRGIAICSVRSKKFLGQSLG